MCEGSDSEEKEDWYSEGQVLYGDRVRLEGDARLMRSKRIFLLDFGMGDDAPLMRIQRSMQCWTVF